MDKQNIQPGAGGSQGEPLTGAQALHAAEVMARLNEAQAMENLPSFPVIGTPKAPRVIDWSKPVRTVGGQRPVHIYFIDHRLKKPVVGYDSLFKDVGQWLLDGSWECGKSGGLDLENIPEISAEAQGGAKP